MTSVACRHIQGTLFRDEPRIDEATLRHHMQVCPACRAAQSARAKVRESVRAVDDAIDDLTKARVLGRILDELAPEPMRRPDLSSRGRAGASSSGRGPRGRARLVWSLALAVACGVVVGVTMRERQGAERTASVASARPALEPYALHLGGDVPTPLPGHGLDRLELPAHAWMRARLGPRADLTLLGPLEVAVRDSQDRRIELGLTRGTVVGDFDGAGGHHLRICTGDATVEIVGTRFLVEAKTGSTRISVAHGHVRVESRGRVRMVDGGTSWSTDKDEVEPLPQEVRQLFERATHGGWSDASADPSGDTPPAERATSASHRAKERGAKHAPLALKKLAAGQSHSRGVDLRTPQGPKSVGLTAPGRGRSAVEASSALAPGEAPPSPETSSPAQSPASAEAAPSLRGRGEPSPRPAEAASMPRDPSVGVSPPESAPKAPVSSQPASLGGRTSSDVYRQAEAALARGDEIQGKELLQALVSDFPHEEIVDSARFELALLAKKAGRSREALAETRAILGHGGRGPFVEPARFLRCRVYLDEDRDAAASCLGRFVHDYPQSPHDAFALRALTELAEKSGSCSKAAANAELYLQRHPDGDFAAEARRVRSHCGD